MEQPFLSQDKCFQKRTTTALAWVWNLRSKVSLNITTDALIGTKSMQTTPNLTSIVELQVLLAS
eukprot:125902-Amphidinium_carterae.1